MGTTVYIFTVFIINLDEKASPQTEYYHEYYIKNSTQILPMYLIQYEYDPSYEKKTRESPPCENCETSPATIFCTSDKANLCTKCDKSLHESKVASKHIRTPLQKGSFFGSCRHHANEPIKYYCSVCHIPVCVNCKMIGNHSNGESNLHKLVSVTEAYATVIQESNQQDPLFEARLLEITNQISAITSRAKAVEKMGFAIQSQIDEIYRRATEQLRGITRRKMDVLCSDKLELERQSGEYKRLTEFVKYGVEGDPMLFLFGWARQQKVRSELHDFAFFRSDIDVLLDVRVIGGVSVVVDQDPSKGREKQIDSRDNSPHREVVSREVGGMVGNQSPVRQHQNVNSIGLGIPKSSEKRVQRRTSDFFAETLGAFDQFSVSGDDY